MNGCPLIFAQLTDLHVGGEGLNPVEADGNLRWALVEMAELEPRPACVLLTGDLVCAGRREELERFRAIAGEFSLPLHALPANHDLWGQQDAEAWEDLVGPRRGVVDLPGLRLVLWDDMDRHPQRGLLPYVTHEKARWLEDALAGAPGPVAVAHHAPILPVGDAFHDCWLAEDANRALDLFRRHHVLALITGHWHRNGEWEAAGVRVINTGALCGWQWTGIPPHHCFPTRPGYRLFAWDGRDLRSLWREGSYYRKPAPRCQVTLQWVGPAHTGGPRPQVHPVEVSGPCRLKALAYAPAGTVAGVEWSLYHGQWQPMAQTYAGLWSEWEADLDPRALRPAGELVCCVRAHTAAGPAAVDAVPLTFGCRDSASCAPAPAYQRAERVFELFYPPE